MSSVRSDIFTVSLLSSSLKSRAASKARSETHRAFSRVLKRSSLVTRALSRRRRRGGASEGGLGSGKGRFALHSFQESARGGSPRPFQEGRATAMRAGSRTRISTLRLPRTDDSLSTRYFSPVFNLVSLFTLFLSFHIRFSDWTCHLNGIPEDVGVGTLATFPRLCWRTEPGRKRTRLTETFTEN